MDLSRSVCDPSMMSRNPEIRYISGPGIQHVDVTDCSSDSGNYTLLDEPNVLYFLFVCLFVCLMVLNATFKNILAISWQSVLLVEESGGPGENHRPVTSH